MYRAGIDLGGTNIKAGIVDEQQHIIAEASVPTNVETVSGHHKGYGRTGKNAFEAERYRGNTAEEYRNRKPGND